MYLEEYLSIPQNMNVLYYSLFAITRKIVTRKNGKVLHPRPVCLFVLATHDGVQGLLTALKSHT